MNLENMLISDGYVTEMGVDWKTPTPADLEKAIAGAMVIENKTWDEIVSILEAGGSVRWCQSPNFFYDHSYGKIGTKRTPKPVEMVACACGHTVANFQVMRASLGTSCPDCYDRMSD